MCGLERASACLLKVVGWMIHHLVRYFEVGFPPIMHLEPSATPWIYHLI